MVHINVFSSGEPCLSDSLSVFLTVLLQACYIHERMESHSRWPQQPHLGQAAGTMQPSLTNVVGTLYSVSVTEQKREVSSLRKESRVMCAAENPTQVQFCLDQGLGLIHFIIIAIRSKPAPWQPKQDMFALGISVEEPKFACSKARKWTVDTGLVW